LFSEGKVKLALLSLLSALVIASTAFVGVSIYAMKADDEKMATLEEGSTNHDNSDAASSDDDDDGSSSEADVESLFAGLVVCDVGVAEISGETQTAASSYEEIGRDRPTVSVSVMSRSEVAELADSETETAASEEEEESSSTTPRADCGILGEDKPHKKTTSAAEEESDRTSTSGLDSDKQILVIDGHGFAPGQVVLMFMNNELRGIDDVDEDGEIEAKIPVPENSETAVAGIGDPLELRLVESGTQRTGNLDFDGETLTANANSDIEVDEEEDEEEESSTSDDE
jgi:hypothetical protein